MTTDTCEFPGCDAPKAGYITLRGSPILYGCKAHEGEKDPDHPDYPVTVEAVEAVEETLDQALNYLREAMQSDDGSDPDWTNDVMAFLAKHGKGA